MNPERICAFYSYGPHYVRMLRCLRENYPAATLVAAIPTDFPYDAIDGLVNETVRIPGLENTRGLRGGWIVLRLLRQAKCSHMVVMFDSPRLNLLSALSGIRHQRCFTVDGRFYSLTGNPASQVLRALLQPIQGRWQFLRAWWGTLRAR